MTIKEFEIQVALGTLTNDMLMKLALKSTSTKILTKLSKTKDFSIIIRIAHNPNTPKHILRRLSKDPLKSIRHSAQMNLKSCGGFYEYDIDSVGERTNKQFFDLFQII